MFKNRLYCTKILNHLEELLSSCLPRKFLGQRDTNHLTLTEHLPGQQDDDLALEELAPEQGRQSAGQP